MVPVVISSSPPENPPFAKRPKFVFWPEKTFSNDLVLCKLLVYNHLAFQDTCNFFQGTYNLRLGKPLLSAPGGKICKIYLPFVGPNVHCPEDLHYATKVKYKDKIVLELCYCCC